MIFQKGRSLPDTQINERNLLAPKGERFFEGSLELQEQINSVLSFSSERIYLNELTSIQRGKFPLIDTEEQRVTSTWKLRFVQILTRSREGKCDWSKVFIVSCIN